VRAHERALRVALSRRDFGDARVERRLGPQHAVDELGRERRVARIEPRLTIDLDRERRGRERIFGPHAPEHHSRELSRRARARAARPRGLALPLCH